MSIRCVSLSGTWKAKIDDEKEYSMTLPGTLDENRIGHPDVGANQWHPDSELGNAGDSFDENAPIATRFTRKYTYEGPAYICTQTDFIPANAKRTFIDVERARVLTLMIDGKEVPHFGAATLSTPHCFEVTDLLKQNSTITFISDNSYPGLPHDAIVYSSAATDETQTNWNGLLGNIAIREENYAFLEKINIYPIAGNLKAVITIDSAKSFSGTLTLDSEIFETALVRDVNINAGKNTLELSDIKYKESTPLWDEYEGNLHCITATLRENSAEEYLDRKEITFGIRSFGSDKNGRFALNGRPIFIRSEANCAEFPEEGHPPMTKEEWICVLEKYKAYGINYMRFHSHCPPEAAFCAADELGMLMQPELSHWNPKNAFDDDISFNYYEAELKAIVDTYANHPSFVALTLGNELQAGAVGLNRMQRIVNAIKGFDPTRMYAIGSNEFYGERGCDETSDFYASQMYFDSPIRGCFCNMEGYINNQYPNAKTNYDATMERIRKDYDKPVITFEVGQYEVLPDFDELELFKGVSDPANYRIIKDRVLERGLMPNWKKYVEATGELSLIGYREEVEAVLRTPKLSGISLLGLQDFPGQGTALVGMMNSHLLAKPFDFAKPERFKVFFKDCITLCLLDKYTYENTEKLNAKLQIANYGRSEIEGSLIVKLSDKVSGKEIYSSVVADDIKIPSGGLFDVGELSIDLDSIDSIQRASALTLKLYVASDRNNNSSENNILAVNEYPVWVYPHCEPVCPDNIYETETLDEKAISILNAGGKVYLSPQSTKEALPSSIKAQFTTDFWSVGTFAGQEGGMGQLIDKEHPIFRNFPTESHSNWQWWAMASRRAVILPKNYNAIITEMDSYAFLRPMAKLIEFSVNGGKLMFSTMYLKELYDYPEARALQKAIYDYMASDEFNPKETISIYELKPLVN